MKRTRKIAVTVATAFSLVFGFATAASAETKVTLNDFYRPFALSDITPKNMQKWPYYRYTSMNWDEYGLFGTVHVMASKRPAKLRVANKLFDIQQKLPDGRSFVESLTATQTKGVLILKDNVILAEFYDNGFSQNQTQLLQSSSKTYAGIVASKLIDAGKLDPNKTVESYVPDFKGSKIGKAKVQYVLDMQSGLLPATDYHVPGGEAFMFEIEQGLKPGNPTGHRKAIINTKTQNAPGEIYNYNDKNTDLLAILAEEITSADLFEAIDSAEFVALTDAQKARVDRLLGLGVGIKTITGSKSRAEVVAVFGGGSETVSNLVANNTVAISRGVELGIGRVKPGHVAEARK